MANWRKPVIFALLYLTGSRIPHNLKYIKRSEYRSFEELKRIQQKKLKSLLSHAYRNVPYYTKTLEDAKIVNENGEVQLENFRNVPILTKDIIRDHFEDLKSKDPNYKKRKPYLNSSGGSTGEPIDFIQDKVYREWNFANKIYYKTFVDQQIGDKEFRLWGSERDLLYGKETLKKRLHDWLYNRVELNALKLSPDTLKEYLARINKEKPSWIETYALSMYEFAKFIKENNLHVHSPKGILLSAETPHQEMKDLIEEVFRTRVFNRYGSREAGDMACSCEKKEGLHLNMINHYIEILDENLEHCNPGEMGQLYVTTLNNYSMPLIRYYIGDTAIPAENEQCSCGRGAPLIKDVLGKQASVFKRKDGSRFSGASFVVMMFFKSWIKRFQIVQKDYDLMEIYIILNKQQNEKDMEDIELKIKKIMGEDCKVRFDFVDEIKPTKSGKYLYAFSEIK